MRSGPLSVVESLLYIYPILDIHTALYLRPLESHPWLLCALCCPGLPSPPPASSSPSSAAALRTVANRRLWSADSMNWTDDCPEAVGPWGRSSNCSASPQGSASSACCCPPLPLGQRRSLYRLDRPTLHSLRPGSGSARSAPRAAAD